MAIAADGSSTGTIGGGPMELRLIRQAQQMIAAGDESPILIEQIHDRTAPANRSGMICSGAQLIAMCPVRGLILPQGRLRITGLGVSFIAKRDSVHRQWSSGDNWCYEENVDPEHYVYVAGGGHVGLALCRALAPLDFYVTLFDHRQDLHTVQQNCYADRIVITPFETLGQQPFASGRRYGVIVSTNFKTDELALLQFIHLQWEYLGIMGSPAKIEHLFAGLRQQGIAESAIARVRAPIGIPINSHTAEEIAISIAADLIHHKNTR